MNRYVHEKPLVRRNDTHEFRFYLTKGHIRIVPLRVQYGEIVPAKTGGITLKRRDLQRMPEALEVLVGVLNEWRVKQSKLGSSTPDQVEAMKSDAASRRHIYQQRIDPS